MNLVSRCRARANERHSDRRDSAHRHPWVAPTATAVQQPGPVGLDTVPPPFSIAGRAPLPFITATLRISSYPRNTVPRYDMGAGFAPSTPNAITGTDLTRT